MNPRLHHPVRTAFRRRDGALDLMDTLGFETVIVGVGGSDLAAQSQLIAASGSDPTPSVARSLKAACRASPMPRAAHRP